MRETIAVRGVILCGHAPAAVDDQEHALIFLFLVLARDQTAGARGGLPVDRPRRIALAVFAQLVELRAFAAPAHLQHADLREAIVGGKQRIAGKRAKVRVDAHWRRLAGAPGNLPELERRINAQLGRGKGRFAARKRSRLVGELCPLHGAEPQCARQSMRFEAVRRMVGELDGKRRSRDVSHAKAHIDRHAEGERRGKKALELGRADAPRGEKVDERYGEQCAREERPLRLQIRKDGYGDGERRERGERPEEPRAGQHYLRGASIFSSSPLSIASLSRPSSSSSGAGRMRWRSAGSAIFFTSSGVT